MTFWIPLKKENLPEDEAEWWDGEGEGQGETVGDGLGVGRPPALKLTLSMVTVRFGEERDCFGTAGAGIVDVVVLLKLLFNFRLD